MNRMPGNQIVGFAASFGAAAIAVAALVVSIVEMRIMREEQHMAVWPRLVAGTSGANGGFRVLVQNKGLGPAEVKAVSVGTSSDGPQPDWDAVLGRLVGAEVDGFTYSTLGGAVLLPGEELAVLTMSPGPLTDSVRRASANLTLALCYCSAYDDCWWLSNPHLGAATSHTSVEPAEECRLPEQDRFEM